MKIVKIIITAILVIQFLLMSTAIAEETAQTANHEETPQNRNPVLPIPYKDNYVLYTYSDNFKNEDELTGERDNRLVQEGKFQISLQLTVFEECTDWCLGVFYNQKSFWQLFDHRETSSEPFREHNYNPGGFVHFNANWGTVRAGAEHESNGRQDVSADIYNPHPGRTVNRALNRVFIEGEYRFLADKNLVLYGKFWNYIKVYGDNQDIQNITGLVEARIKYYFNPISFISLWARKNAAQLDILWTIDWLPLIKLVPLYLQWWSGYGESLIDYDNKFDKVGIGVAFFQGSQ